MKQIIIDCDPGHDDAVAIMLAHANRDRLSLSAITTVCGNNTLDKISDNARIVTELCGIDAPLYRGAVRPLVGEPVISSEFHGESGMDGPTAMAAPSTAFAPGHAVEALRDILRASPSPVTIVALAPLTNIALLIRTYPELIESIAEITLMGGGVDHGNITPFAEFNIFVDPEAAQIVFSSDIPITMSGLDMTEQALLPVSDFAHLADGGPVGKFFCELMAFYGRGGDCMLHDPCAVAWLLQPELFGGIQGKIHVELSGERRGQTVFTPDPAGNTRVLNSIDVSAFNSIIVDAVACLEQR